MKSNRRDRGSRSGVEVEDFSGENWDADVIDLLLRDGESTESVIRPESPSSTPKPEKENDLSRANLTGASLNEAHLNGAELMLAQLSHAGLRTAHLSGAHLSYANLHAADLQGVDLSKADLSFADLSKVDLRQANLEHANMESADLRSADLRGARLATARLTHAKLNGVLFDDTTDLPFERKEAGDLGMVYVGSDAEPDVTVTSGEEEIQES